MTRVKSVTILLGLIVTLIGVGGNRVTAGETDVGDERMSSRIDLSIRIDASGILLIGRFPAGPFGKPALNGRALQQPESRSWVTRVRECWVTARVLRRTTIRVTRQWVERWLSQCAGEKGTANADRR